MQPLSPYEFDQTNTGWRSLDAEGRYVDAAEAIVGYINHHQDAIKAHGKVSIQTLHFHAGQEYAMAGPDYYNKAIEQFLLSYKQRPDWDAYVDGMIALLQGDTAVLEAGADRLRRRAEQDSTVTEWARLLEDFLVGLRKGQTYADVYGVSDER